MDGYIVTRDVQLAKDPLNLKAARFAHAKDAKFLRPLNIYKLNDVSMPGFKQWPHNLGPVNHAGQGYAQQDEAFPVCPKHAQRLPSSALPNRRYRL